MHHYLYAKKENAPWELVATIGSEPQLLAYARWATLESLGEQTGKFEQGSALAGKWKWKHTQQGPPEHDQPDVPHNPAPSML